MTKVIEDNIPASTNIAPQATTTISTKPTHPSDTEVDNALSQLITSNDTLPWRKICMSTLSYLQHYSSNASSGNTSECTSIKLKLKTNCENVVSFLVTSINRFITTQLLVEENDVIFNKDEIITSCYEILGDVFWLNGNLLLPEEHQQQQQQQQEDRSSSSTSQQQQPQDNTLSLAKQQDIIFESWCDIVSSVDQERQSNNNSKTKNSTQVFQYILEPKLLEKSKIIESQDNFTRRFKKISTEQIYKQRKFNLFVEESEGYAKLLTLLSCGKISGTSRTYVDSSSKKIRELIGTFDLDPNRVLDVVVQNFMYRCSEGGDSNEEKDGGISNNDDNIWNSYNMDLIREFKTDSIPHLLGYVLREERQQQQKHEQQPTNNKNKNRHNTLSLYRTCAFFAIQNVYPIEALIPHLHPSPEENRKLYLKKVDKRKKELKKLGNISLNASSSSSNGTTANKDGNNNSEEVKTSTALATTTVGDNENGATTQNQFLNVATVLVESRAWEHASKMLQSIDYTEMRPGKYRGIGCTLFPKLGKAICNLIHYIIEPLYSETVRKGSFFNLSPKQTSGTKTSTMKHHHSPFLAPEESQTKQIHSMDDLFDGIYDPILTILDSCCIGQDTILYCKLCRLFRLYIQQHVSSNSFDTIDHRFKHLLSVFLVPSLSLYPSNAFLSLELWSTISLLPFNVRYSLYDDWRCGEALEKNALRSFTLLKPLNRIECEIQAGLECSYVLKRLSKENMKDMCRRLSKISHGNPIVVFHRIFVTMEAYDNLIPLIIDSLKFVTGLGLDIISYCILHTMMKLESSTASSGNTTSSLISPLETFTGHFYKKYPDVELYAILSYIRQTFSSSKHPTLYCNTLRSLLRIVGGYDFIAASETAQLSEVQLDGKGGSSSLKRETSNFGIIEKKNQRASKNLKEWLFFQDDGDCLGKSFLLRCATMRTRICSGDDNMPIKVHGSEYDDTHGLMLLLLEFLTDDSSDGGSGDAMTVAATNGTDGRAVSNNELLMLEHQKRYASILPSMHDFVESYLAKGVDDVTIWALCRSLIRSALFHSWKRTKEDGSDSTEVPPFLMPYLPSSESMRPVQKIIPDKDWQCFSYTFYWIFWSLSLYDIDCPTSRYQHEIARLKKEQERLIQKCEPSTSSSSAKMIDSNTSSTPQQKQPPTMHTKAEEVELERVKKGSDVLVLDCATQEAHVKVVRDYLCARLEEFFFESSFSPTILFTYCFFPRLRSSPEDAMYCAKLIPLLHKLEVTNFKTIMFLDSLIDCICGSLFGLTEDEGANLSIFLSELWSHVIVKWRYEDDLFEKEVVGTPGSVKDPSDDDSDISSFDYTDYRRLYSKWHAKLGSYLIGCLESREYIHTRIALIILSRTVSCYPTKPKLGDKLLLVLKPLQDDASKPDIQVMANGYAGRLTKIRDDVDVSAYYHKETDFKIVQEHADKKLKEDELRRNVAEKKRSEMKEESDRISRDMHRSDYSGRKHMAGGNVRGGGGGRGGYYATERGGSNVHRPPPLPPPGAGHAPPDHHHHTRSGKEHPPQQALPPMQQASRNYRGDNRGAYFNIPASGAGGAPMASSATVFRHGGRSNTVPLPPPPPPSGLERRWEMPASDTGVISSKRPLPDAATGNNSDHVTSSKRPRLPPPPPPPGNNPKGRRPGAGPRR